MWMAAVVLCGMMASAIMSAVCVAELLMRRHKHDVPRVSYIRYDEELHQWVEVEDSAGNE